MSHTNYEMPGSITVYRPEMAAEVATMFNAFNELWPGGFGGGVPYTEQRVRDWLDQTTAVADLIALDTEGKPVGYCGVYPHYRDRNACYVTILGVVPHVKGYKFGKRLLLRAVELAIEHGYTRLDLHTWAGNMEAVPLYKKTGLFWVPETSVYMQNYLPGLARTPLATAWLERHPDWYATLDRELTQTPDDTTVDGMALYTYRFVAGEDELVGEVDRYGWGLSGIRSTLDGERLGVKTRLEEHELRMGLPNALTLIVENGTDRDLELALLIEPFAGLTWEATFPLSLTAPRGETTTLTRAFVVDKEAKTYSANAASERVRSRIILEGQILDLVTGGKIRPAVGVGVPGGYHTAHPGIPGELHLDVINHADSPLTGRLTSFVEGTPDSAWERDLALAAEETVGITAPLPAGWDDAGVGTTTAHLTVTLDREGQSYAMPTTRLPIVSSVPDHALVVRQSSEHELHLLTDTLSVYANLKGGQVNVGRRDIPDIRRSATFEIGPPFGNSLDSNLTYTHRVERRGDATTLVLVADSLQFPGLRLERAYRVQPGSREVEHWITLTALSATPPAAGGRFSTGGGFGGLSFNPYGGTSEAYTPVGNRIIAGPAQLELLNDTVVPQSAAAWTETWTAQRSVLRGDLIAIIWDPAHVSKVRVYNGMLSQLELAPVQPAPGETVTIARVWLQLGTTSLMEVRRRWNQLVGKRELGWDAINVDLARGGSTLPGALVRPVEARWDHPAPLIAGEERELTLVLDFAAPVQLAGKLQLDLPEGWQGAFHTAEGPAPTVPMPLPKIGQPESASRIDLKVVVTPPAAYEACVGALMLRYRGEYELTWELPLLVSKHAPITVERRRLEDRPVIHVDNGALRFDVVADTGGQLIHLEDVPLEPAGQGAPDRQPPEPFSFLEDVFPDSRPKFFVTDFVGGTQPLVFHTATQQIFHPPTPLTSAEPVAEGVWQGVQVSWTEQHDEHLRGQAFALTYLVAPGLPMVRLRVTRTSPSDRRFEWMGGFLVVLDQQAAETLGALTYAVPGTAALWPASHPWRRFPVPQGFMGPMDPRQPWAWAEMGAEEEESEPGRPVSGRTLGFLGLGTGTATPVVFHIGDFAGAFLAGVQHSASGVQSLEYALVVNRPREEATALQAALAGVGSPPE